MKKFLTAAAVVAIMTAAPAFAQSVKTASTTVTAEVAQDCTITNQSSAITLTTVGASDAGAFSYSCNFIGSPSLTITSLNGGVKNPDNGGDQADYGVYLNDTAPTGGPAGWAQASTLTSGVTFNNITTTTAANTTTSPSFYVGLTQPVTVAGTYSDTLTITIAP